MAEVKKENVKGEHLNEKNTIALVGFILSLTYCLSLIGLILSVIGLADAKKYKKQRKGFAIAGIIISTLIILANISIAFSGNNTSSNASNSTNKSYSVTKVEVTNFSTMSESEAKTWCSENNIICTITEDFSDSIESGKLISQSIIAGQTINEYSTIELLYSKGKNKTEEEIKNEFKASCNRYTYDEISRNPDNYKGLPAVFTGEVAQVMESSYSSSITLRVNVTLDEYGWWDDTIYVTYYLPSGSSRILEKDIVTIYGTLDGLESYTAVLGNTITIPRINAKYIE